MEKPNGKVLSILLTAFVVLSAQMLQAQFCTVTTQDITCNGEQTGIISFNSSGGTAPYIYEWSHDPANSSNEATNLAAGLYDVTITDAVSTIEFCSVEIFEPTPISITNVIEVDPMCGMMDGSLEIIAVPQSGGALSDLMYSIDGGGTFQTSNTFNNLGAADYLIIIADNNGCFIVDSRQLVDATTVVVNVNSAMCEPGGTIAIDIDPTGGTLPYDYLWSNGATTQDIAGVAQGSYSVTVTDREGCSAESMFTVDNCCDATMFCGGTVTNTSCSNNMDGAITVSPTGGSGIFTYLWDTGETTATISGLAAGFYDVTVTDDTGCEGMCGFEVMSPTPIEITDIITTNSNCGAADGSLTITASPQSGNTLADLSYSINAGASYQASNTFTGLSAGLYNIAVQHSNGCTTATSASVMDSGGLTLNVIDAACESSTTVALSVLATGGTGPYLYSWTSDSGFSGVGPSISGAPQGIFQATVTDANGCMATVTITQNNCCDPSMYCTSTSSDPSCSGDASGSISINPVGGVGPFNYTWSHDATLTVADATDLMAGFYNVTVTDAGGCSAMCGIQLNNPSSIVIDDVAGVDAMCSQATGSITVTATPKTGSGCNDLEYSIDGGMNFQTSNSFNDLISGDYLVIVRDCDLCSASQAAQLMSVGGVSLSFTADCINGLLDIDVTAMGGTAPFTYSWTGPNGFTATTEDIAMVQNGDYTVEITDADGCSDTMMIPADIACFIGSIQGSVWEDLNGNGVSDPGESGQSNIPVNLFNANGVLVSTSFTGSGGDFIFEGQDPGQYYVEFEPGIDYSFTLPNIGSNATDSDVTNEFGVGTTTLLNFTGVDLFIDAGIHQCVPVGELVWFDLNENDQWDPSENGINGLEVRVWKKGLAAGYFMYENTYTGPKPNTSSDDGYYKFCLPPGEYYLEYIIPPFGLVPVVPGIGSATTDSDLTGANGPNTTNSFTILSGEEKCDLSAGYYPMATLGNNIFLDSNGNGLADVDEFGMSDVTVEIYNANSGEMVDSQRSDADGNYLFDYLQKDDYYLKVLPPSDYIVTLANVGNNEDTDSDIDSSNGPNTSPTFSLDPGMNIENVDIGLVQGITVAVDWVSVSGINIGSYNQIDWTVGFQYNTDYFEVERRTPDESSFRSIGSIDRTNATSNVNYQFKDTDINDHPLAYYRVMEVDINGNRSYSKVVSIDFRSTARATKVSFGPNPFISDLIIEIDTPLSGQATFSFWDISGKKVELPGMNNADLEAGINTLNFDWSGIPAGVYTAQVLLNNNQFMQKLIKIE